ncbi:MAG: hypothetical protein JRN23_00325 [Nitrososphaerota archaeon]|jgi:hypothetical protein|nr:hypothetical protein [Nitrososphaerota archaeon]MDG7020356.1 hypothetical protein [Nitrososphaerota archaeon]
MRRPNPWLTGGVLFLSLGAVTMAAGIAGGGLVSPVSVVGPTIPSVFWILFGVILLKIGTRPKG